MTGTSKIPEGVVVLGVDPGEVVGVALLSTSGTVLTEVKKSSAREQLHQLIFSHFVKVEKLSHVKVGVERPYIGSRSHVKKHVAQTLEVYSSLSEAMRTWGVTVSAVPPALSKRVATDETLRRLSLYTATKDGHANDAARLALMMLLQYHPDVLYAMTNP